MSNVREPTEEQAHAVLNEVATIASKDIDVEYIENIVGLTSAEDVVHNVQNTPYKANRAVEDGPPPSPFNSDGTSNPPADRSSTSWIVALLWFLSREAQRSTPGYLRKSGNERKIRLLKEYVNANFPLGLNELAWSERWQAILKFGIDDEPVSVHDLVNTAKRYLRDLPDPLIPERHRPFWVQILDRAERGDGNWIRSAQHLLLLMPAGPCYLLKTVLKYLKYVFAATPALQAGKDQLNAEGIYTCFAQCILHPPKDATPAAKQQWCESGIAVSVVRPLVEHHHEVTSVPRKLSQMLEPAWLEKQLSGLDSSPGAASAAPCPPSAEPLRSDNVNDWQLELEKQCEEDLAEKSEQIVALEAQYTATPRSQFKKRREIKKEIKVKKGAVKKTVKTLTQLQSVTNTPQHPPTASAYATPAPLSDANTRGTLPTHSSAVKQKLSFMTPQPVKRPGLLASQTRPKTTTRMRATSISHDENDRPVYSGDTTTTTVAGAAGLPVHLASLSSSTSGPLRQRSSGAVGYPKKIACPSTPARRHSGHFAGSRETFV
eukprot:m.21431 g.21431  ORF g.21431 m.21431 type:complete len:546 (-) comp3895_c0_seq2:172-1809(-)